MPRLSDAPSWSARADAPDELPVRRPVYGGSQRGGVGLLRLSDAPSWLGPPGPPPPSQTPSACFIMPTPPCLTSFQPAPCSPPLTHTFCLADKAPLPAHHHSASAPKFPVSNSPLPPCPLPASPLADGVPLHAHYTTLLPNPRFSSADLPPLIPSAWLMKSLPCSALGSCSCAWLLNSRSWSLTPGAAATQHTATGPNIGRLQVGVRPPQVKAITTLFAPGALRSSIAQSRVWSE